MRNKNLTTVAKQAQRYDKAKQAIVSEFDIRRHRIVVNTAISKLFGLPVSHGTSNG